MEAIKQVRGNDECIGLFFMMAAIEQDNQNIIDRNRSSKEKREGKVALVSDTRVSGISHGANRARAPPYRAEHEHENATNSLFFKCGNVRSARSVHFMADFAMPVKKSSGRIL